MMKIALLAFVSLFCKIGISQNYQAIHGSPYAGSLGIYNNPASGIHNHDNWDVTLFSVQLKSSTNGFSSTKPLLKLPQSSVFLSNGRKERFVHISQDARVLNGRIKLNQNKAVAFGANLRTYVHVNADPFNYLDTISAFKSLLTLNRPSPTFTGNMVHSMWTEGYISYSQVLRKTSFDQLSAGITVKGIRTISAAYLYMDRMTFTESTRPGENETFYVTDPEGRYGYSSNFDQLDENKDGAQNRSEFMRYTQGSVGFDVGIEYFIKDDYPRLFDDVERLEYNWKIGISVLDIGRNFFKHGEYSRRFNGIRNDLDEEEAETKFSSFENLDQYYDSLESVVQVLQAPQTPFYVYQPTRLVVNVDKHLKDDFYVNGEVSINFFSTKSEKRLHTRELNMVTVTPRWETSLLGVYLPVQVNTQGQFWVGSAVKAGPFLLGIHDWRWLFSKKHVFSGGGYIALIVKNFFWNGPRDKPIKNFTCPPWELK